MSSTKGPKSEQNSSINRLSQTIKKQQDTSIQSSAIESIDNNYNDTLGPVSNKKLYQLTDSITLKNNKYSNYIVGFSIKFDNDWQAKIPEKTNLLFAGKSKLYAISVSAVPIEKGLEPSYSQEEANQALPQLIAGLKQRGVEIDDITMQPGTFKGKKSMITIIHMTDFRLGNTTKVFQKLIQVIHKNKLINIWCSIPFKIYKQEIKNLEKQLSTMTFF